VDSGADQPEASSGDTTGKFGLWTDAALDSLVDIDAGQLRFVRGPLGIAISANGRTIGRIDHYPQHKVYSAKIVGHVFWLPPGRIVTRWHYNPGKAAPTAREAKAIVTELIRDANHVNALRHASKPPAPRK
jgi:hypothetical protein